MKLKRKIPFHYVRVLTRAQVSARGTDTEKRLVLVFRACVSNPRSWEIMFPYRWSFDQWKCGLYVLSYLLGIVLCPLVWLWAQTELPVSLECPRWDCLALGFLACLHERSLVTATSRDSFCVHVWVFLFLTVTLVTSLHLSLSLSLSLSLPTSSSSLLSSYLYFLPSPSVSLPLFIPFYLLALSLPPPSLDFLFQVCWNFYLCVSMHECSW